MTGVITRVNREFVHADGRKGGGFGFIRDEDGRDRFFHARSLRGVFFDEIREGQAVTFQPVEVTGGDRKGNGLQAVDVEAAR